MRIADWPIERVRWLWVGVTVYLATLIVFAVTLRGSHQAASQQREAVVRA
jgi:hypothetical protein